MQPTKVLIVDDHTLFRRGVRSAIECEREMEVVGEAKDGVEALTKVIKSTHQEPKVFAKTLKALIMSEQCFQGKQFGGIFEREIATLPWAKNNTVVLVEVHHPDNGTVAFTWATKEFWDKVRNSSKKTTSI